MTGPIHNMDARAEVARIGGKAATLVGLADKGFDVPAFLVLEPGAFTEQGLPAALREELLERLPALGPGPYAARSSAQEEDGASHSHAGQFLTLLNLDPSQVPDACCQVWRSGVSVNVADYRASRGLEGHSAAPAVIVQQMVDARCAGVAFTADPVSGRRDRVIVSAVEGLGDRLVGGEEDGQTYVIGKAGGAVLEAPDDAILTAADLTALRALAQETELACGGPQDIEWAFNGERLYLLQARAITTELRAEAVEDGQVTLFDNSNIVESYPGLVSPLTYSFAQYAYSRVYRSFVRLVGVDEGTIRANATVFDNMLARIDGRVYYNLVNWYRALSLLPGFSINSAHMETMMGVGEPLPREIVADIAPPPARGLALLREWLRVGRMGLLLAVEAIRLERSIREFKSRLDAALAEPAAALDGLPLSALAAEYRRIEADLLDRWDAPLVNDFLCMMAFGGSRKLLERWAGPAGLEAHNDIMIGQGDIVSAEPAQRIRDMGRLLSGRDELREKLQRGDGSDLPSHSDLAAAVAGYLEKFADRCTEELKLESVTLDRDPTPLYAAVAAAAATPQPAATAQAEGDRAPTLDQLFAGRPLRRIVARSVVDWAKGLVRHRENLRFERTRIFGRARRLLRAVGRQFHAGGLIDQPDDIVYLTVQEILGAIEGFAVSADLAGLVALRKTELAASRRRPDPPERFSLRGAVLAGLQDLTRDETPVHDAAELRSGTGCSAGTVTAVARIVRDPRTQSLQRGEILVARHTDPGWIAIFCNASAIVVERGSLLSHSAIVARELGIPCVVGLKGAMSWIADGETIAVDGATGEVRKTGD